MIYFCIHSSSVPQPQVTITRSHSGSVYSGTELILSADISYSELQQRAVDMDISLDVWWTRDSDVTTISATGDSNDNYTASLTYSPIATSDSGQISVTVIVRPSHDSLYVQSVTASDNTRLDVEGMGYHYTVTMVATPSLSPPDLPDPVVTISGHTTGTAGGDVHLTCSVRVVEYLTAQPTLQWSGGSVDSENMTESDTIHSGVMSMKTLTFSPLLTSHGAKYTCQADINIPSISLMKTASDSRDVMVESKSVTSSPLSVVCVVYC